MYFCDYCTDDCKLCPEGNPCLCCVDYDIENDTCSSYGGCGQDKTREDSTIR